eukprot:7516079-Pyramimonas_sp.AAC.1
MPTVPRREAPAPAPRRASRREAPAPRRAPRREAPSCAPTGGSYATAGVSTGGPCAAAGATGRAGGGWNRPRWRMARLATFSTTMGGGSNGFGAPSRRIAATVARQRGRPAMLHMGDEAEAEDGGGGGGVGGGGG